MKVKVVLLLNNEKESGMIQRALKKKLLSLSKKFPAIGVVGPRQSGKTTLVQDTFPKKPYVLLEDIDVREFASKDPRGFFSQYPKGAILDEVQRVPQLFSYLQGVLDEANQPGMFILTGSQNFLLMEKITQSLAGRISVLTLLPFSMSELAASSIKFKMLDDILFCGMYPRIHDKKIAPRDLYSSYVSAYIERDLRQLKNVHDLSLFYSFLKMCALRTGQILNLSSLADDCGITHNTARAWISILETSYIIYLLQPHHRNFKKRLIKMPKLYFCDTGLAAYLADIQDVKHLSLHPLKGALFETLIISEILKKRLNGAQRPNIYFWRDKSGKEIDCLIEEGASLIPIEIKSGQTITQDYFKNLNYFNALAGDALKKPSLVYGGLKSYNYSGIDVISFRDVKF